MITGGKCHIKEEVEFPTGDEFGTVDMTWRAQPQPMKYALALALLAGCGPLDDLIEEICAPQDAANMDDTTCPNSTRLDATYFWDGEQCVDLWEYSCWCEGEDCADGYRTMRECVADHDVCWDGSDG